MAFPDQEFGILEYLAACGETRSGELAIGPDQNGPMRWFPSDPMMQLPDFSDTLEALVEAAAAVENGVAHNKHIRLLLDGSAGVGGARPKAALLSDGRHVLAKFRAQGDPFAVPRVEAVCLSLAAACGIEVPPHRVVVVSGKPVFVVERFDRAADGRRIGYASASTLMEVAPSTYATDITYADLASKARAVGIEPCEEEIFARMLFNCFVGNTDDHLRNHGFVKGAGRWRLSPLFDIEPRRGKRLILAPAKGVPPAPDPSVTFAAHSSMRIPVRRAREIYDRLVDGMRSLPGLFERYEVGSADQRMLRVVMAPAFTPPAIGSTNVT
jgi:serine/threonine-protein kinase HipA